MAKWLPPKAGQQPIVPHPTLQHISGQKKLTNKIILDTNIRAEVSNTSPGEGSFAGDGGSRPFVGPPGGGLVSLEAAVFAPIDALLGPGITAVR
jgi:hypothetical protein